MTRGLIGRVTAVASTLLLIPSGCDNRNAGAAFVGKSRKLTVKDHVVQGAPPPEASGSVATPRPMATPAAGYEVPDETPGPDDGGGASQFSLEDLDVRTRVNKTETWVVSHTKVYRIELDELRGYPRTEWTLPNVTLGSGHRTFVSEIGLLVGKTYGASSSLALEGPQIGTQAAGVYLVSDDNPGEAKLIFQPEDWGNPTRLCVTSFKVSGTAYVGVAYRTADNMRKFVRFPIDKTKPNKVNTAALESVTAGTTSNPHASYSCYVDQARGYFWVGGYRGTGGDVWGVDIAHMQALPLTAQPNNAHTNNAMTMTQATSNGSYALAGDGNGNVLTVEGMYTMAHEAVSDIVFGSVGGSLTATRGECFHSVSDCTGKHWSFAAPQEGGYGLGPLSSLNDGRVVGLGYFTGRTAARVYLLELLDRSNPAAGIKVKKIAHLDGDPYMYTDFTGATLYPADVEKSLSLKSSEAFRSGVKVSNLRLKWISESGNSEQWRGLKLEVRCYPSGVATKPAFAVVDTVGDAGVEFAVSQAMCKEAIFDTVDVRISGFGSTSAFSRTKGLVVLGEQAP